MKAINIRWDTDEDESVLEELPTEIEIPEEIFKDCETEDEIADAISDYISDETGFCHFGFELASDDYENTEPTEPIQLSVLYKVVGINDLEGSVFAVCSTEEKAIKAMRLLAKEGFEDMLSVVVDDLSDIDTVSIGNETIRL